MAEISTTWDYSLMNVRAVKTGSRTATPTDGDTAYELKGVDASILGSLRPFYGFKYLTQLATASETIASVDGENGIVLASDVTVDTDPTIPKIHSFVVRAGPDSYIYGFVYLVKISGGLYVPVIEYRIGTDTTWLRRHCATYLTQAEVDDYGFSITTWGRFLYIGMSSRRPIVVYWDWTANPPDPDPRAILDGGPGQKPELIPHDQSLGFGGITGFATEQVARGQIMITDTLPSTSGLWVGTPPQDDGDTRKLAAGDYAFAYRLYHEGTNRWSALSTIAPLQSEDFVAAEGSSGSSGYDGVLSKYAVIELILDTAAWPVAYTHVYVYRSVRTQSAGPVFYAAILHPDNIVDVEAYQTDTSPIASTVRIAYWFDLEDKELVFQVPYRDAGTFEDEMPYAGTLAMYENTLFASTIRSGPVANVQYVGQGGMKNVGEMRWSSLVEPAPEMFPPWNRFVPNVPSNEIIAFETVTGNLIGFSRDRQYHVHKEGTYIRVQEMHQGFGVVNSDATTVVGSLIYFVNRKGVKVVDADGQLESLHSTDEIILDDWRSTLSSVSMAYDSASNVLYILNPDEEEAILVWFNTSTIVQLDDMAFTKVFNAELPDDLSDATTPLVSRMALLGAENNLYVPDYDREKVISGANTYNGSPQGTLMDFTGDAIFKTGVYTGGSSYELTLINGTVGDRLVGCYIYNLTSTSVYFGYKAKITAVSGQTITIDQPAMLFPLGSYIGVSPIFVQWVGHQVGLNAPDGTTFGPHNMFTQRVVESLGAHFSDVEFNESVTTLKNYEALIFRGNSSVATLHSSPRKTSDGTVMTAGSILDNEPTNHAAFTRTNSTPTAIPGVTQTAPLYGYSAAALFPGIRTFIPRLDYRLLAARVTGKIRLNDRQQKGA